jgi:integrase
MNMKQLEPGLWLLDVRVIKDGKVYRKRQRVQGGLKAAEARYLEIRKELQGRAKEKRSLTLTTFKHVIEYYLERNAVDPASVTYFDKLKSDIGNVEVSELRNKFDQYLLLLRKTKVKHTDRFLSLNTVNRYIAWAKAAVNCAVRAGVIEKNPLQYFQKFPTRPRDRMLTETEKDKLIEAVQKEAPDIHPIVLYSLLVPCRRGELTTLKRTDYNMVTNTIHIPAERTKMKRPCIKPVPDCLKEYMRNVPIESEYLFYRRTKQGQYLPIGDFRGSWKKCCASAGIENYRFHDQRRVAYTDLLLAGNAPHIVMQVSGHATDMSKVYFGRNEMLAAQSLNFSKKVSTFTCPLEGRGCATC